MRTIVTAALQWQYLQTELILWIHLVYIIKLPPPVIFGRKVKSYVEFLSVFMTTDQAGWSSGTILFLYFGDAQFESWPRHQLVTLNEVFNVLSDPPNKLCDSSYIRT
jgi:hypothetical protein